MVTDMLILGFAGVIGFVAAGITASFYRVLTHEPARFGPAHDSAMAWLSAVLFGALAGPIIILQNVRTSAREGQTPRSMLAAGAVVAGLWSGCIGILMLAAVMSLRDSLV